MIGGTQSGKTQQVASTESLEHQRQTMVFKRRIGNRNAVMRKREVIEPRNLYRVEADVIVWHRRQ